MSAVNLNPLEKLKRRRRTEQLGRDLIVALRQRLPKVPLEMDVQTEGPVKEEDGTLLVKTDGSAILRVQGVANDLTRQVFESEGIEIIARVWPRSIWCRHSTRDVPSPVEPGTVPRLLLYSSRDYRGNTLLCLTGSHEGEHDFTEPDIPTPP